MAKRGSRARGRGSRSSTRPPPAPRPSEFGDTWLQDFRERGGRYADLTDAQDRRRWHPRGEWPVTPAGLGRATLRPRIVVVPEGHKLARHQTYGGRYSIADVQRLRKVESKRYGVTKTWVKRRERGPHGVHDVIRREDLPYRIGFTLPWQVIVCVRRKRRKEVMHALRFAGAGGRAKKKIFRRPRRNQWSEVRC